MLFGINFPGPRRIPNTRREINMDYSPIQVFVPGQGIPYTVETKKFPGGEVGVHIPGIDHFSFQQSNIRVLARVQSSDDLMRLVQTTDIIDRNFIGNKFLTLPYFPYARQDRVTSQDESFSLLPFAKIINSLGYTRIFVYDPHSDVTSALCNNLVPISSAAIIANFSSLKDKIGNDAIEAVVSPDAGAAKKVSAVSKMLGLPMITATKSRNTQTGYLSDFKVLEDTVPSEVLIVDDICDGGRTFTNLAKVLKEKGAKKIHLYVTHGIFSQGIEVFNDLINEIYTTDSFLTKYSYGGYENVHIAKVGVYGS